MASDIRVEPEEFDAEWMTEVLEQAGVARGAVVTDLVFEGFVGTGQMSRNGRFRLDWNESDGRPGTVIAKFPSADRPTRANSFQNGAYGNEYLFYTEVASTVAIRTPACWVARYDPEALRCILVMEDLASSVQGDQFEGSSEREAELVIEQAVGLHAPRWGDPTLDSIPFLPGAAARTEMLQGYFAQAVPPCLDRLGHGFSGEVIAAVERFARVVGRWTANTDTPRTVVHGDFRPDNFLFGRSADAPPLAVVDWQTASIGVGPTDVAYFLGGAFPQDERRRIERDVIEQYRLRLEAAGVAYSKEDCWRDFRWGALHGVLIGVLATLLAAQTERGDRLFTLMISRHAQHAIDLDALDLVEGA